MLASKICHYSQDHYDISSLWPCIKTESSVVLSLDNTYNIQNFVACIFVVDEYINCYDEV